MSLNVRSLDEATSAIDKHTDTLVQDTIHTCFSECTIITIAHRIDTINDSDRVLVLSDGCVEEFDDPRVLQQDPNSAFSAVVKAAELQQK
jgi:ABC-type multidrug transport system fused ATPase/permease subunit